MSLSRKRWVYFVLILLSVMAGLATRVNTRYWPSIIAEYGGDVLYASCIFFCLRSIFINKALIKLATIGYVFCVAIEVLQLYQAPWIQKVRQTPPFGLILGYGFLWSDVICYLIGSIMGYTLAALVEKKIVLGNT